MTKKLPKRRKINRMLVYISILNLHIHYRKKEGYYVATHIIKDDILSVTKYCKLTFKNLIEIINDIHPSYIESIRNHGIYSRNNRATSSRR